MIYNLKERPFELFRLIFEFQFTLYLHTSFGYPGVPSPSYHAVPCLNLLSFSSEKGLILNFSLPIVLLKADIQSASATDAAVVVTQESPFQLLSSVFCNEVLFQLLSCNRCICSRSGWMFNFECAEEECYASLLFLLMVRYTPAIATNPKIPKRYGVMSLTIPVGTGSFEWFVKRT